MKKMLHDYILVKPIERQLSSIITVKNTERSNIGEVIVVGPGKEIRGKVRPLDVKVGEIVRYGEFMFPEYFDEETRTRYQIIQEADIAAIVEEVN